MITQKFWLALCFLALILCASPSLAQQSGETGPIEKYTQPAPTNLTVEGKITFLGGRFYVLGKTPPGEFLIVNENPVLLGRLQKEGKYLTVEGHLTYSADLLFIEKIDGRPYP